MGFDFLRDKHHSLLRKVVGQRLAHRFGARALQARQRRDAGGGGRRRQDHRNQSGQQHLQLLGIDGFGLLPAKILFDQQFNLLAQQLVLLFDGGNPLLGQTQRRPESLALSGGGGVHAHSPDRIVAAKSLFNLF